MPFYGYARVSSIDQDLRLQRATLKAAGCEVVRAEKASLHHELCSATKYVAVTVDQGVRHAV
jgi:Resolvase, N terminal domain